MPTFRYKDRSGNTLPSVTTVLGLLGENKRALIHSAWRLGTEGKDYRDEWGKAANAGTAAHSLAEIHMTSGKELDPAMALAAVASLAPEEQAGAIVRYANFKMWLAQNTYQPVASEVSLVSDNLGFGGTIDAVGLLHGEPAIIDLKSKTLYKDQIIQVAAYRMLWDENHPDQKIKTVHILGMSDGFHHHQIPIEMVDAGGRAFLHLRALYWELKGIKC